jgi:hypothetical protein
LDDVHGVALVPTFEDPPGSVRLTIAGTPSAAWAGAGVRMAHVTTTAAPRKRREKNLFM